MNTDISSMNSKLELSKSLLTSSIRAMTTAKSLFKLSLSSINLKNLNPAERFQGYAPVAPDNTIILGAGPTHYQAWNRYFIIKNKSKSSSKEFNTNNMYVNEQSPQFKKEHLARYYIPDDKHFYFILTDEYLNVLTSRFVRIYIY